jgi:N-acetylglucosaminyl-diphospho-decaprenol L-rhamnosyltransferase
MAPDLTISIICTNNRAMLCDCLKSLYETTRRTNIEVFVVDNASTDGTADMLACDFPQVRVLRNDAKLGFTSNNNLVLERATGRYVMLLNDDTLVLDDADGEGAIDNMVAFMDAHPEAAVAGGQLLNPDGSLQQSFCHFPRPVLEALHPFTDRWRIIWPRSEAPEEIDWASGASLLVRRDMLEKVGGLDPDFNPIYSEETDWCYRIKAAGGRIFAVPTARFVHFGGQTMNRVPARRVELLYSKRALYFRKHQGRAAALAFKIVLWLTSLAKLAVWAVAWPFRRPRAQAEIPLHWHMVRRALSL